MDGVLFTVSPTNLTAAIMTTPVPEPDTAWRSGFQRFRTQRAQQEPGPWKRSQAQGSIDGVPGVRESKVRLWRCCDCAPTHWAAHRRREIHLFALSRSCAGTGRSARRRGGIHGGEPGAARAAMPTKRRVWFNAAPCPCALNCLAIARRWYVLSPDPRLLALICRLTSPVVQPNQRRRESDANL